MNRGQTQQLGAAGNKSTYEKGAANQEYCVPGDTTSCAAPIAEWKFEDGSGTTVNDTSGNDKTATLGSTNTWVSGKIGRGLKGDGTSNSVASVTADPEVNGLSAATYEAWVKRRAANAFVIAGTESNCGGAGQGYDFGVDDNGKGTQIIGTGTGCAGGNFPTNDTNWHHITFVFDGSLSGDANRLKGYLDGVQQTLSFVNYGGATGIPSTIHADGSNSFKIGDCGVGCAEYMDGIIDQLRIYNYARTPAQVAWDYNKGGPLASFEFDECQGTALHDSSGNGNTETFSIGSLGTTTVGTCNTASSAWGGASGNSTTNSGKINNALTFDGTDDNATGTITNFPTADFAISSWIYPTSVSNSQFIYNIHDDLWAWIEGGCGAGHINFKVAGSTQCTNGTVTANAWSHVVVTRTGSTINYYINGVQDSAVNTNGSAINISTCVFMIGADTADGCNTPDGLDYGGRIDEIKIFNYGLTATQVKSLYSNGAVNFAPTTGVP
jgi:hypothetical protein